MRNEIIFVYLSGIAFTYKWLIVLQQSLKFRSIFPTCLSFLHTCGRHTQDCPNRWWNRI